MHIILENKVPRGKWDLRCQKLAANRCCRNSTDIILFNKVLIVICIYFKKLSYIQSQFKTIKNLANEY